MSLRSRRRVIAQYDAAAGAPLASLCAAPVQGLPVVITDNGVLAVTFAMPELGEATVSYVTLTLHVTHEYMSDLGAVLTHPDGTTSVTLFEPGELAVTDLGTAEAGVAFTQDYTAALLADYGGGDGGDYRPTNDSMAVFEGLAPNGTWTLELTDAFASDVGMLQSATLCVYDSTVEAPLTSPPPPVPGFTWNVDEDGYVDFDATTTSGGTPPYSHEWELEPGDGFGWYGAVATVTNAYQTPGGRDVTLRVTDANALVATLTQAVAVTFTPRTFPGTLFTSNGSTAAMYRVDPFQANGLAVRNVIASGSYTGLAASPDGSQLAFIDSAGDVYVCDADGSDAVLLADGGDSSHEYRALSWSPDGDKLLMAREGNDSTGVDADDVLSYYDFSSSTIVVVLLMNSGDQTGVTITSQAWNAAGTEVCFTYTGHDFADPTDNTNSSDANPFGFHGVSCVAIIGVDGSNYRLVRNGQGSLFGTTACWRRVSDTITYCDNSHTYVVNPDNTGRATLKNNHRSQVHSPDELYALHFTNTVLRLSDFRVYAPFATDTSGNYRHRTWV